MTERRRFIQSEEFMSKGFDDAVAIIRSRVQFVPWEHCGSFMDVVAMHAYLTRDEAENAFYADVFLVPSQDLPSMSAPPRDSIAGLFTFSYPSGLNHNVRFRPDSPV